ncbi:SusD/RagB family nutrient-binding outer membrane lipoprotein [Tunicatimonas pelagia]|uniref:SusD/RagB family nutrient-binding outer membrane lipoprotein n=1 Tax=Tunicatimonas pelagia TaxID=931531 RepID=UPI00266633C7|nr:SusD/RagB family nutrient-binding outer membrane lipoprotein [Tunicatimonas pelagia]WKN46129.1 SusD/RagB family nutrient-binding outer membrane lipoprotein [Tunicatimonas pelagia]
MKIVLNYSLLTLFIFSLSACEGLVEDLNDDPNNASDSPAELIFTGMQLANATTHTGLTARLTAMWTGQMKGVDRQWGDFQVYNVGTSNFTTMWDQVYYGTLRNSRIVLDKVEPQGFRVVAGMTKVTQAHCIGNATSLWGDIPFTEAAQIEQFEFPLFDNQMDIYASLQSLLDEGIADLAEGTDIPISGTDIYYNADKASWTAAAYTLKARYYLDTKQYDLALQAAEDGISSFDGSMYLEHGTTNDVDQNFYWDFLTTSRAGDIAAADAQGEAYLVTLLDPANENYRGNAKTDEAARFNYYYLGADQALNTPGTIEPNTLSLSQGDTLNGMFAQNASFPLITYQENILTLAETSVRMGDFDAGLMHLNEYRAFLSEGGYIDDTYQEHFTLVYEPYIAEDFAAGGMENMDNIFDNDALLREIVEERYVTFYGQTIAWNDERRTRGSVEGIPLTPNAGTELPWRFVYSLDEINGNPNAPDPVPGPLENMTIYQ